MFTTEVASDIDLVVFGRSYRLIKVVALVQIYSLLYSSTNTRNDDDYDTVQLQCYHN